MRTIQIFILLSMFGTLFAQKTEMMPSEKFKSQLRPAEVKEILKRKDLKVRPDLKYEDSPFDYYELPDGRLLLVLGFGNGYGTMYKSVEEYNKVLSKEPFRKPGEHMLSDLIADDQTFLSNENTYFQLLAKRLNLPISKLDFSFESLKRIDSSYGKSRPEMNIFFREDYLYLIAYLGEVYKREIGGEWFFERQPGVPSYIPFIKLKNGVKLDTYYGLFKECYEHFENMSIYALAIAESVIKTGKGFKK